MTQESSTAAESPAIDRATLEGRMDNATRLIRVAGALILLVSVSSFLVQRWDSGNDVLRYFFLLSHTVLLGSAALLCGGKLGEARSARMFLWLGLAVLPANYAVLGGLVYSQARLDPGLVSLPQFATWQAPSLQAALICVGVTVIAGLATAFLAARGLFRKKAGQVALSFTLVNLALLVPVRSPNWTVLVAVAFGALALFHDVRALAPHAGARTLEGRLVRALFAVPPVIVALRTVLFYEPTLLFVGGIIFAVGLLLFVGARKAAASVALMGRLEMFGGLLMSAGILVTLVDLSSNRTGPVALLPAALALFVAGRASKASGPALLGIGSVMTLVICASAMLMSGRLLDAACAIVFGLLIAAVSTLLGRWYVAVPAALVALGGVLLGFELAIGFGHFANWGTLSALGATFIVLAGVVERKRSSVIAMLQEAQRRARALV